MIAPAAADARPAPGSTASVDDRTGALVETAEQRELASSVARLLSQEFPPEQRQRVVDSRAPAAETRLWPRLAELGLPFVPVPEDAGGAGGAWVDLCAALESVGAALAPTPALSVLGAVAGLLALGEAGQPVLAPVLDGEVVTVLGLERGSDLRLAGDRLSGAVLALGPEATAALVLGVDRDGRPVSCWVSLTAPGVEVRPVPTLDLLRPAATVVLTDVPARVLARGDRAGSARDAARAAATLVLTAEQVGGAAECLRAAVAHATTRHQFGRPVGSFQGVRHPLAEVLVQVELARSALRHLAVELDAHAAGGADASRLAEAVALARIQGTHALQEASARLVQTLGGIGFTWEEPAHLFHRRAGSSAALLGTVAEHRRALAGALGLLGGGTRVAVPTPQPRSAVARELAAWVASELPRHRSVWGTDDGFAARLDWQRRLHAGGWVGLGWPTTAGGRGLGVAEQVECDQVLTAAGAPALAGVLGVNNVGPTLLALGTEEQRAHLPAILSGDEVWCQGFSEPEAGSDLVSLRTRGRVEGEGEDAVVVVDGQKTWTSEGMHATHCELLVRTDPDARPSRGITALLVPMDTPGITRRPIVQLDGTSGFAEVFFDGVRVPRSAVLGDLHDGWAVTRTTLGYERAGVIILAGRLEQTVRDTIAGLAGRNVDEQVALELTDRFVEARLLGVQGSRVLASVASGRTPGAEQSVVKLAWSTTTQKLGETRLAALGAGGALLATDDPTHAAATEAFLRSRSATIAGGTTEIMREMIANRVLGLPR